MPRIDCLVFDMDGTVIDDEWAHEEAKAGISRSLGWQADQETLRYFTGRSNRLFWQTVLEKAGKEGDVDQLVKRQFAHVLSALRREKQQASPGLAQLLHYCRSTGRKAALCTGSDDWFVHDLLDLLGLGRLFDVVITSRYAARLKPAPDVYLFALREAGVSAQNAIAFEDSYAGCLAVHGAGMRCIGCTNAGKNPQDLSAAEYQVANLSEAIAIVEALERETAVSPQ